MQPVVERVLQQYGIAFRQIMPPQKGYRNQSFPVLIASGTTINLIFYKPEQDILRRIRAANRVSDFAVRNGLPSRQTIDQRIIVMQSGGRRQYGALYSYLPGHTIPWEAYTMDHIKALGMMLSDLHAVLQALPQGQLPSVTSEYGQIVRRMRRYFSDEGVQSAMHAKLGVAVPDALFPRLTAALKAAEALPGAQALHMDFVRGNILFDTLPARGLKVSISGIIDFEKTAFGHPLLDIARTLAFLFVDCKYKSEVKVRKYFLHSGYDKRGKASLPAVSVDVQGATTDLLEALLDLFLVYDFYKFLRHNPYESLGTNEHFVRTCTILLERRVLLLALS